MGMQPVPHSFGDIIALKESGILLTRYLAPVEVLVTSIACVTLYAPSKCRDKPTYFKLVTLLMKGVRTLKALFSTSRLCFLANLGFHA